MVQSIGHVGVVKSIFDDEVELEILVQCCLLYLVVLQMHAISSTRCMLAVSTFRTAAERPRRSSRTTFIVPPAVTGRGQC
jgi:hypothetical protein